MTVRISKAEAKRHGWVGVCESGSYRAGDPAPRGYLQWHEWAATQHRRGLRQMRCPRCLKWRFPQELPCCE